MAAVTVILAVERQLLALSTKNLYTRENTLKRNLSLRLRRRTALGRRGALRAASGVDRLYDCCAAVIPAKRHKVARAPDVETLTRCK